MKRKAGSDGFPTALQRFFSEYLINQRNVSMHTVASYRDTFCLLLRYLEQNTGINPAQLKLHDLDAPRILGFLDHLEQTRGNCVRSRNNRLAAIRSFLKYAAVSDPSALSKIQQVLAIPSKRYSRPVLGYLTKKEIEAIVTAPDATTWSGHRDRVLFATLYNTGARVSEIVSLRQESLDLQQSTSTVLIHGKGRKQRIVPLWKGTTRQLRAWLKRLPHDPESPLFPNASGQVLTRSGVEHRLRKAVELATPECPSLLKHSISPHTFRHTTAMHLLQSGVDLAVIAVWLGHESPTTTHMYIEADLALKEKAIHSVTAPGLPSVRYQPSHPLLRFLQSL